MNPFDRNKAHDEYMRKVFGIPPVSNDNNDGQQYTSFEDFIRVQEMKKDFTFSSNRDIPESEKYPGYEDFYKNRFGSNINEWTNIKEKDKPISKSLGDTIPFEET